MCLLCTNLNWFGLMKTELWTKEIAEIFILCWIKKQNGGNSLPTKMGGDSSKLCVALILAFIHIHQPETCRDLSKWGDLHNVWKNYSVEKFVKLNF